MFKYQDYGDLFKDLQKMKTDEFNQKFKQGHDMLPSIEKDGTDQLLKGVHTKTQDCDK
jgi:hypothetical protein